jgi:MFS family permease
MAPLVSTLSGAIGTPAASFGFLFTLQYLAFSLSAFIGGSIKERLRLSNLHLVSAGLLLVSAVFLVGAVALRSTAALILWVIPLGIAGGAVETFSSVQIASLSGSGSSKNLCLSQVFYTIGAFSAPQLVYLILGAGLAWESAFVIFGIFSTVVLVFFLLVNLRRGAGAKERAAPVPAAPAASSGGPIFLLMVVLMISEVLMESLSASWLSYIFELHFALTPRDASLVLVLFWVAMMAGRLAILLLPSRWTLWPTLLVASGALFAATACLAAARSLPGQLVSVGLMGVFLGPLWPVIVMTSGSVFPSERSTSTLIGIGAIGFGCGPLLGTLILRARWAPHFFLAHLALGALISVFCVAAWRSRARRAAST